MRLNIGCRDDIKEGWINLDLHHDAPGVEKGDARDLRQFPDNSVEEIYADSVLEHLNQTDAERALKEWYRVLQKGGKLTIIVPDLDFVIALYGRDKVRAHTNLYGVDEEGQHHLSGWWAEKLEDATWRVGFKPVTWFKRMDDLGLECRK